MKNLKRMVSFVLAAVLVMAMAVPALAAEPTVEDQAYPFAQALNEAGIFRGSGTKANGEPEFNLGGTASRIEALVMLVRILGKEKEAKTAPASPFTDVPGWAKPSANYSYAHNLVAGTSPTTFGSSNIISNTEYLTLCLRALGYNDNDFQWNKAYILAQELGIIEEGEYENPNDTFKRADIVLISYATMKTPMKGSTQTLAEQQGVSLREVSRENQLEQPVMPTTPTLPSIVTDRISFLDESTAKWYKNQHGEPVFCFDRVKFGTILKGLTEYQLDKTLTPVENFKRLETVYKSYNTNAMVRLTNWGNGSFSFNVAEMPQAIPVGLPGITYLADPGEYVLSKDMPCNWSTGIPVSDGEWAGVENTVFLNTLCFVDPIMGQQVFMMLWDYYNKGTVKIEEKFRTPGDIWSMYAEFSGDCCPITKEFVEKYGLTYISGEAEMAWLNIDGMGIGTGTVVVTNGVRTWTIEYATPNHEWYTSIKVRVD